MGTWCKLNWIKCISINFDLLSSQAPQACSMQYDRNTDTCSPSALVKQRAHLTAPGPNPATSKCSTLSLNTWSTEVKELSANIFKRRTQLPKVVPSSASLGIYKQRSYEPLKAQILLILIMHRNYEIRTENVDHFFHRTGKSPVLFMKWSWT